MFSMIRRASSAVLPLAIRAAGSSRTLQRVISNGRSSDELSRRIAVVPFLRFSTAFSEKSPSDDKLIRVLESEIQSEESNEKSGIEEIPDGFPFKIHDNLGERTILLERDFQDEIIKVEVDMPNIETEEDGEDDNDHNSEDDMGQCSIPLVVSISKGSGMHIEFGITAFPEEISIDSLSIKRPDSSEDQLAYEGPEFSDLDENLQKAFLKYLEVRGIKPSITNILYEYMVNKDNKEYLIWLKNLKNFIEK